MFQLTRNEIKQRLQALNDPWLSAAFAARMAALALSFLTGGVAQGKPFLWFWKEEKRERYLLAILRAWQCGWSAARFKDRELGRAAAYAYGRALDAHAETYAAADAVAYAAYAAYSAAYPDDSDANANAADVYANAAIAAADAAVYAYVRGKASDFALFLEKNQEVGLFLVQPFDTALQKQQTAFLHELRKLKKIGFDYWADWYEARMRGEDLDENTMRETCLLSDEILTLSPREINAHLKAIAAKQTTAKLNRVRAIFIGDGEAGKTSLIQALHGEAVREGTLDMTPGVEIRAWPVSKDIQADLWDFGGQVVAHATHQFFLRSRCVYVLVLSGRAEIDANQQAEYWLEHVRTFGGSAPVLLVGNKADQEPVRLDLAALQKHYSNIIGFYALSCTRYQSDYAPEFQAFARDFRAQLETLNQRENVSFLPAHFAVMQELEKKSRTDATLPRSHYEQLCRVHKISAKDGLSRERLLDLLDKLGIVIYFPQLRRQRDKTRYILNPYWLTYGVYALIYACQTREQGGRLSGADVMAMLGAKKIEFEPGKLTFRSFFLPSLIFMPPRKCSDLLPVEARVSRPRVRPRSACISEKAERRFIPPMSVNRCRI